MLFHPLLHIAKQHCSRNQLSFSPSNWNLIGKSKPLSSAMANSLSYQLSMDIVYMSSTGDRSTCLPIANKNHIVVYNITLNPSIITITKFLQHQSVLTVMSGEEMCQKSPLHRWSTGSGRSGIALSILLLTTVNISPYHHYVIAYLTHNSCMIALPIKHNILLHLCPGCPRTPVPSRVMGSGTVFGPEASWTAKASQ